jgi:methylated-DNA-[protein]-cysteine S-methyltransferase
MSYVYKIIPSPVGNLKLIADRDGLAAILWENDNPSRVRIKADTEDNENPILVETEKQLNEYFEGKRETFSVPLHPIGTEFQNKVWEALTTIPFGETRSCSQIAEQVSSPRGVRAVGAANGKNPISIIVPCHRVIGASGELTGFAGGLDVKAQLLRLESSDRCSA